MVLLRMILRQSSRKTQCSLVLCVCNKVVISSLFCASLAPLDQSSPFINSWSLSIMLGWGKERTGAIHQWFSLITTAVFNFFLHCTKSYDQWKSAKWTTWNKSEWNSCARLPIEVPLFDLIYKTNKNEVKYKKIISEKCSCLKKVQCK